MSSVSAAKGIEHGQDHGRKMGFSRTSPFSGHPQISGMVADANRFAPLGFSAVKLPRIQTSMHAKIIQAPKSPPSNLGRWGSSHRPLKKCFTSNKPFPGSLALLVGAVVLSLTFPIWATQSKPNVLFIAVDDLRNELGCFGVKEIKTPNLDRLAASGVAFSRAYCQLAVCNPSRVSLMTGLRPDSTKVWDLVTEMRTVIPDVVTIPQHFRKHGYHAVSFGKVFHNPWPDNVSWSEPHQWPENASTWSEEAERKLAEFRVKMRAEGKPDAAVNRIRAIATEAVDVPDSEHFDGAIGEQALAAMRRLAAVKQPFFLAAGFVRPHLPFVAPRKYWDLYDRSTIPLATNGFLPRGAPALAFGEARFQGGFYELRDYMDYSAAPWPADGPLPEAQQRELKHGYYASVSYIDAQIGRLLDELERLGLASNTIVVMWGDHGWKLGEHGGWCKQTNYEIDTRAPLMIRAPGMKKNGWQSRALVEFVDIYPTLCELSGLPVPGNLEGVSLKPLLAGSATSVKEAAFSQFPRKFEGRDYMGYAMRSERYRYIEWIDESTGKIAAQELYDHNADPDENENVAGRAENAALLEKLNARMWAMLPRPKFPQTKPAPGPDAITARPSLTWHPAGTEPLPSLQPTGEPQHVTFINERSDQIELVWVGADGSRKTYSKLDPNGRFSIRTRPGVLWMICDGKGATIGYFVVEAQPGNVAKAAIPKP